MNYVHLTVFCSEEIHKRKLLMSTILPKKLNAFDILDPFFGMS